MAMIKRGTCNSSVIVSSFVYACEGCGHMGVVRDGEEELKECPKCLSEMKLISSHAEEASLEEVFFSSSSSSSSSE